jgi:hypothetical protein
LALTPSGDPAAPNQPSLVVEPSTITVEVDSCISGGLRTGRAGAVKITNSIVDANAATGVALADPDAISAAGTLTIVNSTVVGKVHSARMDLAANTIFFFFFGSAHPWPQPVISDQNQQGCVRFTFLPLNAVAPRRYRCQPDLAVTAALTVADVPKGSLSNFEKLAITAAVQARVRRRLQTCFMANRARPARQTCPAEIRQG